ncbi:Ankyrin-3 [Trichoderma ghanense]|uniref:protein S-acyltransferase n=1 Tax=Trichoderma ghanense TaxID=65468 RepID=A0ABY2H5J7_9HYPO
MARLPILPMLLMLWLAGRASADGGDDFANNLASDLGPIIALFGERVVMQFMSQAMGIADCILLAVAPIGAITTVVSAIRVAGPTWLKSFIGRARENMSAAEVEIMSSTSDEACELWKDHGVVRCPGSADIYQFVCLLPKGSNLESVVRMQTTVRCEELATLMDKGKSGILQRTKITGPRYAWKSFKDVIGHILGKMESCYRQLFSFHVLFSLPLFQRIRRRTIVSLENPDLEPGIHQDESSVSTQVEVARCKKTKVTCRVSRPHSILGSESEKTESPKADPAGEKVSKEGEKKEIIVVVDTSDNSSPNLLLNCHGRIHRGEIYLGAAFGAMLQVGALIYFGIITYNPPIKGQFFLKDGKRIVDYAFPCAAGGTVLLMLGLFICAWIVEKSTTETCYEAPDHEMFVVWLQKDHTVNDQVFKPYAIYPSSKREYITTSRRSINRPDQAKGSSASPREKAGKNAQSPSWDWRLEKITFLGALIALVGFISQFIGMRGLNWTASVVQLAITFVVTMIRVIVRRGLNESPIRTSLLSDTELDWFSLTFGNLATAPWARFEDAPPIQSEHVAWKDERFPKWRVRTGGSQPYHPLKNPDLHSKKARKNSAAHKMMVTRQRLCTLSKWKSTVSEEAALLSRAIEAVAQTFLGELLNGTKLVWTIPVSYKGSDERIFIKLKKSDGKWRVKDGKIEAMLSLWLYSTPSARDPGIETCVKWRVFGSTDLWPRLLRDLRWWMPELAPEVFGHTLSEIFVPEGPDERLRRSVVGFTSESTSGLGGTDEAESTTNEPGDTTHGEENYLVVKSEDSWERFYSRDLLFAFIRSVAKMPQITPERALSERPIRDSKPREDWEQMKLKNGTISSLVRELERIGFGTLSDVYFDLIMPLSLEKKLTNVKNIIDEAIKQAEQHERSRQWEKLVSACSSLLDLAQHFDPDKEASGPMAVAACLEFLYRLRHEADLQRREGRIEEELITQLKILEEELTVMGETSSLWIKKSLAENSGCYATTFNTLIGTAPDATGTFPNSFNIGHEHRKLMQTNNLGETLYWNIKDLEKADSFGWSPLHYAANLQLHGLRIVFSEKGDLLNIRDLMGRTPLHHACLIGNEAAVDLLLDHDAPIEAAGNDGITAVHCAVLNGNLDILKKLVEKVESGRQKHTRKSILHVDRNERGPIHWAAIKGDIALVNLFKDEINRIDRFGWACIHLAVIYGKTQLLEHVLEDPTTIGDLADNRSRTPLHLAVEKKSSQAVGVLLKAGAHVNVQDRDGSTPLHMAVEQESITEMLIKSRAGVNYTDIEGRTALFLAAEKGSTAVAALLVKNDADIAIAANDKRTPLHMAVQHKAIVQLLLAQGANVGAADVEGRTPLCLAAADGAADVAAWLIVRGANVKTAAKDGRTALHVAVNHTKIAEMLLERGADVNAVDIEGHTPLHLAATDGAAEVAALLTDAGADVATAAGDGRTALHMAVRFKDITKMLLEHGAAINAVDVEGYTPLYLASMDGTAEVAALLIDRGADVTTAAKDGRTPLHMALSRGQEGLEIARKLLGFDPGVKTENPCVNATAEDNATPLHIAAEYGPPEAVEMLLHLGAKIDQTDEYGQTALLISIYNGNWDIADLLLEARADTKADSRIGYTPLLGAVMGDEDYIVENLLAAGADIDVVGEDGYSPIHLAVSRDNFNIFHQLLRADANINAVNKFNSQTPLHCAVRIGNSKMVQTLLEKGANTETLNHLGFSPLQYAVYRGDLEIVKQFVQHDKRPGASIRKATLQGGKDGDTPMHTLCQLTRQGGGEQIMCAMFEELWSVAPQSDMINATNEGGLTPLDLAYYMQDKYPTFVQLLMDEGAKLS